MAAHISPGANWGALGGFWNRGERSETVVEEHLPRHTVRARANMRRHFTHNSAIPSAASAVQWLCLGLPTVCAELKVSVGSSVPNLDS